MKTYRNTSIVLLLLVIGLNSCKKYELNPAGENSIWPMEVGNSWSYSDRYQYFKDGQLVLDETEGFSLLVFEKSYEFDRNEKEESYRLEFRSDEAPRFQSFRVRFDGDQVIIPDFYDINGLIGSNTGSSQCSYPYTQRRHIPLVTFPIEEGALIWDRYWYWLGCSPNFIRSYQGNGAFMNTWPGTLEVVQTELGPLDTLIQTPAGSFNCMKYGNAYWSEGTGWIKGTYSTSAALTINDIEVDSLVRTRELTSYYLK